MRDPVRNHHPLEDVCEVIDCPEPHQRVDGIALCGDVLEVPKVSRFTCQRPAGHRLVHIDNSRARAAGVPAWSMVWGIDQDDEGERSEIVPPPSSGIGWYGL